MKKEDFRQRIRDQLRTTVPLEARKQWDDTKLFVWFMKANSEDPYLTWEGCRGDVWQRVPGMCNDLIGPAAVF
jgi:hypothetical protein